jgi:phage terminase large subunit-like protein
MNAPVIQLNKMAAARRQLNTAVWLWFREGDPASIHTMTGAAFGVLSDLYFHRYKVRPVPLDTGNFPAEFKGFEKGLRDMMAATQTFLKHAQWDPDGIHTFSVLWSEHYLFNAISAYAKLKGTPEQPHCNEPLMTLFILRIQSLSP